MSSHVADTIRGVPPESWLSRFNQKSPQKFSFRARSYDIGATNRIEFAAGLQACFCNTNLDAAKIARQKSPV